MYITLSERKLGIIEDYEDILLGKRKTFSNWYFTGDKATDLDVALEAFKYCFEILLEWDVDTVFQNVNRQVVEDMKLISLWRNKIVVPKSVNKSKDFSYIAYLLYPDKYSQNTREQTIEIYKNLLAGKILKMPKNMFDDEKGIVKAAYCLQYLVTEHLTYNSIEDVYDQFRQPDIRSFLTEYSLWLPCECFFDDPVDYLHFSIPDKYKNKIAYDYAKRCYYGNKIKASVKSRNVKNYKDYFLGKLAVNPFVDGLNNFYPDVFEESLYYFITHILPIEVPLYEYDVKNPLDLLALFDDERIRFLLDKYRLLESMEKYDVNYIKTVIKIMPANEMMCLTEDVKEYDIDRFTPTEKYNYVPLNDTMRQYMIYLLNDKRGEFKQKLKADDEIKSECMRCVKEYVLKYKFVASEDEENDERTFEELLEYDSFRAKYGI